MNQLRKFLIILPALLAILFSIGNAFEENCDDKFVKNAALGNDIKLMERLNKGSNINSKNYNGQTALIEAALNGKIDTVNLLIKKGADLNQRGKNARTALMWVCQSGRIQMVQSLLAHGADVNVKDRNNQNALMLAAGKGNAACVNSLLEAGADPMAKDNNGATAYTLALSSGFKDVANTIANYQESSQSKLDLDDLRIGAYF
ncbi:MAG: ankyrin repeat domain-containing protein [Desulfomonilaceae bacterium]